MKDVIAIIHAPGVTEGQSKILINKLQYFLERFNLRKAKIELNPTIPLKSPDDNKIWNTLVIGWGLSAKPAWDKLIAEYEISNSTQEFLAFDLFERQVLSGQKHHKRRVNAGRYWSQRIQEKILMLFMLGYYLKSTTPYGMKRVLKNPHEGRPYFKRPHYVLLPGDTDEIEIVKLIFDLFVHHEYTRTQISNLLTAQSVKPPGKRVRWQSRVVKALLENPVYIGANEFKGNNPHYEVN